MPEISEEVVRAAEEAARSVPLRLGPNALQAVAEGRPVRLSGSEAEEVARAVLEAAAPLIAEQVAGLLDAEKVPCPAHPDPALPRPSCWTCGRNGMAHRLARIARETFPKGGNSGT